MPPARPTQLGRYQILEEIGKGSMGVVYLAKDPLIGRLVALKTFRLPGDANEQELAESRERFIREAQSAGILSHPNIVTVHDVVELSDDGLTFMAMEFVRGTDLKELLRSDEIFDLQMVADIVWQIADALEYAHSKGVVHRDVKPANILITGDQRVKITDFGIARLNSSNLTHAGQLLGTPNYMAPEQIQGREVDHRADIFALGVVIYELLTRQKPFRGDNLTVVSHRIVHEPFTPPEEYLGEIPARLREILNKALAKDPAQRYQGAGELAWDLKQLAEELHKQDRLNDTQQVHAGAAPRPRPEADAVASAVNSTVVAPRPSASAAAVSPGTVPAPSGPPSAASPGGLPPVPAVQVPPIAVPATSPAPKAAASLAPPPPPPLPPLAASVPLAGPGEVLSKVSFEDLEAAAVPVAVPVSSPAPPPSLAMAPPVPAKGRSKGWIFGLAAAGFLFLVALGVAIFWPEPPPPPPSISAAERLRAVPGMSRVEELLAQGKPDEALQALALVETRVTTDPELLAELEQIRQTAKRDSEELSTAAKVSAQAGSLVAEGELALAGKRYTEAAAKAREALALVPGFPPAQNLISRLQVLAPTAVSQLPAPRPPPRSQTPSAPPAVVLGGPTVPAAPVAGDATLLVRFHSERPKGTLMVYAGERQLLREPFEFSQKSGFMRSKGVPGGFDRAFKLSPGTLSLRVYISYGRDDPKERTRTETIEGNFPAGSSRELEVRVAESGQLSVNLR